ncbi:biotin carboxylase N-terminal domain-containing protein [Nocardia sp. CA-107356]|uniref:ATP-binding protein n=1 Tax=Nocardia sp. CA-107356 TaxID=3239972 RepID=UPI003D8ADDE7
MFTRIAIVNRGEAARRLIRAAREIGAEVVALYTDGERHATFVREADHSYCLGPAAARPYLDLPLLARALRETGADAAWVGWGFVAEDPAFAELCDNIGVTFIGPSASAMRRLGDKIGAKLLAEEVGVPVAPWSGGAVETLDAAIESADRIGYPLMLKATAGGGGRGIRMVSSAAELREAYLRTSEEAARAFGSGIVFLERQVTGARHVEVQVIADGQGEAWALGVRDCSVQRRNQKIIEESASPVLSAEQAAELKAAARRLSLAVGYRGACTVEFLYHPGERFFAFLEVNTRLQVEHPITEATTGVDLVKAQLEVAAGIALSGVQPEERGHAVEARLNAEDPDRDFAPSPGRIALLRLPTGPGIRVDTGVTEGDVIPADFDSMIAKIIAYGRDRDEALARLRRAVAETTVVIEGGATNKSFLLALLDAPEVIDGSADTRWVDRVRADGGLTADRHLGIALMAAAIDGYEDTERGERNRLWDSGRGRRPHVQHEVGRAIELRLRERAFRVTVVKTGSGSYRVGVDAGDSAEHPVAYAVDVERIDTHLARLRTGGRDYRLVTATHGTVHSVEVDGIAHRVTRDEGGVLRAPAPALVVATPVEIGAELAAGAPVLVVESMKMETVLRAPVDGRLRELLVAVGSQVEAGAPLARLEPTGADAAGSGSESAAAAVDLMIPVADAASSPAARAQRALDDVRAMLLGFDATAIGAAIYNGAATTFGARTTAFARYLAERDALSATVADRSPDGWDITVPLAAEVELAAVFADLTELSSTEVPASTGRGAHSPREHLHLYLQSLDVARSGLPDAFGNTLGRVLAHYGVDELERTDALEAAVFRIFIATKRTSEGVEVITALLKIWLGEQPPVAALRPRAREVLARVIRVAQSRFPVVADLARSVAFAWFLRPETEAARATMLAGVSAELAALAAIADSDERARRITALVDIPEPMYEFLADRLADGAYAPREPMLEVLARWHYGEQHFRGLRAFDIAGRPVVVCDYVLELHPTHAVPTTSVSTVGTFAELPTGTGQTTVSGNGAWISESAPIDAATDLVSVLRGQLLAAPDGNVVVVDLHLLWPDAPASAPERADALRRGLTAAGLHEYARRIVVAVVGPHGGPVEFFTFRRSESGFAEDQLVRGVHPLVGRRLSLWRLRHFHLTRVETPEPILLYHCVARENPDDQRLVALAQVPRFEVVRDERGSVVTVGDVDTVLSGCVEAIGRARHYLDPAGAWLDMNHIWLDIRPTTDVDLEEFAAWQRKVAPQVAEAGVQEVLVQGRLVSTDVAAERDTTAQRGSVREAVTRFRYEAGSSATVSVEEPPTTPLEPLDDYDQKVLRARRRGTVYPYELITLLTGSDGVFTEFDLDADGWLAAVDRPRGGNSAGIVVGLVSTPTPLHPEGICRVALFGDPTKALGAVSEAECARIIAALDLAERLSIPVEWFALSAGARISMDSGTENMDWVARALRRIVSFTQDGGEINVVVAGINVGAQPYWNAEATMLMHTKGILVMTPDGAMVLTGKQSLDFSGGVSAEDNFGIGGYARVMGPNGQAQYWAANLAQARDILLGHYAHTYTAPGEATPRRADSTDPVQRDITGFPHPGPDFATLGEVFSATVNPDRKKPFDIRTVLHAVADQDHPPLERWADMAEADTAVVTDARIGGWPVCLIGIESKPVVRHGFPPADGPDTYTAGTLFPRSSKKVARAINAASGNRPLVVLANLSGFDGSPESMRTLQLEYGAEIGRAIVNFTGKIVFCVISRYHGGAFVVFSKALNPNMTVLAIEGSFASVIGGAPAAAVVFARAVDARTLADPRVRDLEHRLAGADIAEQPKLATELVDVRAAVRAEQLASQAAEFDGVHSIERAVRVGSVDAVIAASELRPRIAESVAEWMNGAETPAN